MSQDHVPPGRPAIGLIETNSVARGIVAADAMAKRAPIKVLQANPVCPGKYIVLIGGMVDPVHEAMAVGRHYAGGSMADSLVIDNVHDQVVPAIAGTSKVDRLLAVGIIETYSVAGTILAADAACKAADIWLMEVRLANGLGGKAFLTMTGEQHMVEAALAAGVKAVGGGVLQRQELIPAPHDDMRSVLL